MQNGTLRDELSDSPTTVLRSSYEIDSVHSRSSNFTCLSKITVSQLYAFTVDEIFPSAVADVTVRLLRAIVSIL